MSKTVTIYGKKDCIWCKRAADECFKFGQKHDYRDLDEISNDEFINVFASIAPMARSIPIVVIDDVWVGGYEELRRWLNEQFELSREKPEDIQG